MKSFNLFLLLILIGQSLLWGSTEIITSESLTLRGTPKYKPGFKHFDYVNPQAPKGGSITYSTTGTFDSFHRFARRGISVALAANYYDTLMVSSDDEIEVYYGLVAKKIEYPTDYTWIIFHINPKARFHDGKAITADDVVFTFYKFFNEGVPQYKQYYADVDKVEVLDQHRVKFSLKKENKEMLVSLASTRILPKHYWESKNFGEPTTEIPLSSWAYKISDYKMGQYIIYERVKDYWAKDLPVMKGLSNFDFIRYDYYRDETVALEAFKAGEFDLRQENVSKYWATLYTGSNFDNKYILKEDIPHDIPQGMQALVFNIQKPVFKNPITREAIIYTMDFEWMNKNLFYDQYTRTRSYFQNTKYEAKNLPSKEELQILEPLKGKIPDRVFTEEYQPPKTDGSGNIRSNIRKALRLFKKAGWSIKDKKLVNDQTGKPLEFEVLIYSPTMERVLIPIQNNCKRMGIKMTIRKVDTSQFTNRMRTRDYDMISGGYSANYYPDSNLKIVWHSKYLDYTYNAAGVQDPAIDTILEGIEAKQEDEEALLHYGRALDRVLQWNFFVIPEWHISKFRVAYWNKFSRPAIRPKYALGVDSWWVDKAKEAKLPNRNITN
ncbi:MAG: ABC transporter substrate-binding protein [Deltaproteobacteria bacterium]|nr:ABC transporter substrate-binding protein [Deltaproteobacteria bacterium]